MPIHFRCDKCKQKLIVSSKKAGSRGECPKCKGTITVPIPPAPKVDEKKPTQPVSSPPKSLPSATPSNRQSAPASRSSTSPTDVTVGIPPAVVPSTSDVPQLAALPTSHAAPIESPPNIQITPNIVVDDEPESWIVYDDAPPVTVTPATRQPLSDQVTVTRWVLYAQGILLGIVAIVFFMLGSLFGGGKRESTTAAMRVPCTLTGNVSYSVKSGERYSDDGSVVIVLPLDEQPEGNQRIEAAGLRPDDPPAGDDHEALRFLRLLGGGYARTDSKGDFTIRLPHTGKFFVLVVSHHGKRKEGSTIPLTELTQMVKYLRAIELIGDKRYRWTREDLARDRRLTVVLE